MGRVRSDVLQSQWLSSASVQHGSPRPHLHFWRDNIGTEVDMLVEEEGLLFPADIKSGATFQPEFLRSLQKWVSYAGSRAGAPALICGGDQTLETQGVQIISWRSL